MEGSTVILTTKFLKAMINLGIFLSSFKLKSLSLHRMHSVWDFLGQKKDHNILKSF